MENKWYDSDFFGRIASGIGCLLICLGIGTCGALWEGHIKIGEKPKEEIKSGGATKNHFKAIE